MSKPAKFLLIFIIIIVESALAVTAGMTAIYLNSGRTIPPGIYAGKFNIGGLARTSAADSIETFYKKEFSGNKLEIKVKNRGSYYINYSDLGVHADGKATVDEVYDWKRQIYFSNFISSYLGFQKTLINPIIKMDEGKLREKLLELKMQIDTDFVDATVDLIDGKIVKKPEVQGVSLNVRTAAETIGSQFAKNPGSALYLSDGKDLGLDPVPAKVTLKDFNYIQRIISSYSTDISDHALAEAIKLSSDAINKTIVTSTFSFVDRLKIKDKNFQFDSDGYDQVASTLYAALLKAGFDKDNITRLPHKLAPDYIELGLDAWISENAGDLMFTNKSGSDLFIMTEIRNDSLTVALAGSSTNLTKDYELKIQITQKFDPPVSNLVNTDLKTGERITLSPGKPGMVVNVYRNNELISTDKYDAEKKIVQVGPDTGFSPDQK